MARVILVRGWEVNRALGRDSLAPHKSYPITWMRYEGPIGRMRCQVMDFASGNTAHFPILTIRRLRQLPEVEMHLGDDW